MDSIYEKDRVTVKIKSGRGTKELVGDNMKAHLDGLRKSMITAAENLEFEEAARIRDEVRRLDGAAERDPLGRGRCRVENGTLDGGQGRHAEL